MQTSVKTSSKKLAMLVVLLSFLGASCASPSGDTGIVSDFPSEPLTLKVWRPLDEYDAYAALADRYHEQHPNVTFEYRYIAPEDFETEVIEGLANGNGPDIIALDNDRIPAFADKLVPMPDGFFRGSDLYASLSARYAPAVITDTVIDGDIYGIPFSTESLVIYWNRGLMKDLFQVYSRQEKVFTEDLLLRAPADWDEVVEATKLIVRRDGDSITQAGIALGLSSNVPRMADITAAMMLQRDVEMTSPDRQSATYHLASPDDARVYPGAQVLEYLKGFVDPSSPYYTWNANMPDAVDAFIDGKVAMLIHHPGVAGYIAQRNPNLDFKIGAFPQLPSATRIVDYAVYPIEAVTTGSTYPQVAWDFLSYSTNRNLSIYKNNTGRTSPLRKQPAAFTVLERTGISSGITTLQVPSAESWYKGTDATRADKTLNDALDRVSQGLQSARDALDQAAREMTTLLESS